MLRFSCAQTAGGVFPRWNSCSLRGRRARTRVVYPRKQENNQIVITYEPKRGGGSRKKLSPRNVVTPLRVRRHTPGRTGPRPKMILPSAFSRVCNLRCATFIRQTAIFTPPQSGVDIAREILIHSRPPLPGTTPGLRRLVGPVCSSRTASPEPSPEGGDGQKAPAIRSPFPGPSVG